MRHFSDTLVWLGVILVVAAVIYFTPQFASYVSALSARPDRSGGAWRVTAFEVDHSRDFPR
jgi:hypothetical protein